MGCDHLQAHCLQFYIGYPFTGAHHPSPMNQKGFGLLFYSLFFCTLSTCCCDHHMLTEETILPFLSASGLFRGVWASPRAFFKVFLALPFDAQSSFTAPGQVYSYHSNRFHFTKFVDWSCISTLKGIWCCFTMQRHCSCLAALPNRRVNNGLKIRQNIDNTA